MRGMSQTNGMFKKPQGMPALSGSRIRIAVSAHLPELYATGHKLAVGLFSRLWTPFGCKNIFRSTKMDPNFRNHPHACCKPAGAPVSFALPANLLDFVGRVPDVTKLGDEELG